MDIADIIITQRSRQNLSQRALAQKAGIRQATLSSIEAGGDVKLATARSILHALGLELEAVPLSKVKNSSAAQRAVAIRRVLQHVRNRRGQLRSLLQSLSVRQLSYVSEINTKTNTGYLAELWDEFLRLDRAAMQSALDADRFKGMAWQSLLQANPFIVAKVGSWA